MDWPSRTVQLSSFPPQCSAHWSSLNKDSSTDSTVCTLVFTQQGLFNRQHRMHFGPHSTRTLQQTALCSFWSSLNKDSLTDSTVCTLVLTQQGLFNRQHFVHSGLHSTRTLHRQHSSTDSTLFILVFTQQRLQLFSTPVPPSPQSRQHSMLSGLYSTTTARLSVLFQNQHDGY